MLCNEQLADTIGLMTLTAPRIAPCVKPGQFVHMRMPGFGGHILRRPFSVFDVDENIGTISVLYQVVGQGTAHMFDMQTGQYANCIGPVGHGWQVPQRARNIMLVGGGIGSAPLYMLAKVISADKRDVHVVLGAQNADMLASEPYFSELPLELHICTDDGSKGHHGFTTDVARDLIAQASDGFDYIATCGPAPMLRGMAMLASEYDIPCEVSMEERMACGIGACLGCVVDTFDGRKRACVDGPIFDAREVAW